MGDALPGEPRGPADTSTVLFGVSATPTRRQVPSAVGIAVTRTALFTVDASPVRPSLGPSLLAAAANAAGVPWVMVGPRSEPSGGGAVSSQNWGSEAFATRPAEPC